MSCQLRSTTWYKISHIRSFFNAFSNHSPSRFWSAAQTLTYTRSEFLQRAGHNEVHNSCAWMRSASSAFKVPGTKSILRESMTTGNNAPRLTKLAKLCKLGCWWLFNVCCSLFTLYYFYLRFTTCYILFANCMAHGTFVTMEPDYMWYRWHLWHQGFSCSLVPSWQGTLASLVPLVLVVPWHHGCHGTTPWDHWFHWYLVECVVPLAPLIPVERWYHCHWY